MQPLKPSRAICWHSSGASSPAAWTQAPSTTFAHCRSVTGPMGSPPTGSLSADRSLLPPGLLLAGASQSSFAQVHAAYRGMLWGEGVAARRLVWVLLAYASQCDVRAAGASKSTSLVRGGRGTRLAQLQHTCCTAAQQLRVAAHAAAAADGAAPLTAVT